VLALAILLSLIQSAATLDAAGADERSERAPARAQWSDEALDLGKLFDTVVETVNRNFYNDVVLKRHNWTERAQAARQSVLSAPTVDDAVRQINKLLAELETSHTALYTPDDYQYYILLDVLDSPIRNPAFVDLRRRRFWGSGPYYPGIGIFTREIGEQNFVDGVLEGSPAANIGLALGDEILSVDGRPYSPIAAFRGKIGTPTELMVRRAASAEPERLTTTVAATQPVEAFSQATEASARVIERNGKRIGYAHIWALAEGASFAKAVRRLDPKTTTGASLALGGIPIPPVGRDPMAALAAADAAPLDFLVVDVRGRVGGNIGIVNQLLQLLDGGNYWGGTRTVARGGSGIVTAQKLSFRGRSALLIDGQTRSAGEIMAYGYRRNAFGPLLGTPTAGAVLSGSLHPMPGDTLLYLATVAHETDGQTLEGIGVAPDYRVEQPLPYAHGADPVLDAAVSLLAGSIAK
jgi:carboxyl-terminal processing protease